LQETDYKINDWLPTTLEEVKKQGWEDLDVIFFSGDAYVDHPAFGPAVIGRLLQKMGLSVAIVPQPNWRDDLRDFKKLGKPNLCFAVSAGNMDSMVNHYTANKRLRSNDAYTAGGKAGFRPDYPTIVYTQILKKLFPETPVIIGGIEASLRRLTHFDYRSEKLHPSILYESGADLLVYGMGEKPIHDIFTKLKQGSPIEKLTDIPQTSFLLDRRPEEKNDPGNFELASHELCLKSKMDFAKNFAVIETESNKMEARKLIQKTGKKFVVVNPPYPILKQSELDAVYDLPYTRMFWWLCLLHDFGPSGEICCQPFRKINFKRSRTGGSNA
jgi:uncharacterized radical SAM protein YgiQ